MNSMTPRPTARERAAQALAWIYITLGLGGTLALIVYLLLQLVPFLVVYFLALLIFAAWATRREIVEANYWADEREAGWPAEYAEIDDRVAA